VRPTWRRWKPPLRKCCDASRETPRRLKGPLRLDHRRQADRPYGGLALAEQGVSLVLSYRRSKDQAEKPRPPAGFGRSRRYVVQADVSDRESVRAAVERVQLEFPGSTSWSIWPRSTSRSRSTRSASGSGGQHRVAHSWARSRPSQFDCPPDARRATSSTWRTPPPSASAPPPILP